MRSCLSLNVDDSVVVWQRKQIGKMKSSVSGCLMNWLQIRKWSFWSAVFFYSTQWAILKSYCDVWWNQDFVWQPMRTSSWLDWEDPKNSGSLINRLPFLQASSTTICRENGSTTTGGRKCFPRVHQIPKYRFLCSRNKQTYFSLAKMFLL